MADTSRGGSSLTCEEDSVVPSLEEGVGLKSGVVGSCGGVDSWTLTECSVSEVAQPVVGGRGPHIGTSGHRRL